MHLNCNLQQPASARGDDARLAGWSEQSSEPAKDLGVPVRRAKIHPDPLGIDGHVELALRQCTQAENRQTWPYIVRVNGDSLLQVQRVGLLVSHGSFPRPILVQADRGRMQRYSLLPFPYCPNDPQRLGPKACATQEVPSADGEVVVVPCVQDGGNARRVLVPFQQGL
jgi:hypothetical protein